MRWDDGVLPAAEAEKVRTAGEDGFHSTRRGVALDLRAKLDASGRRDRAIDAICRTLGIGK